MFVLLMHTIIWLSICRAVHLPASVDGLRFVLKLPFSGELYLSVEIMSSVEYTGHR